VQLPQQDNSYDCGLFLLHYVELFLTDAPSNFNPLKIDVLSGFVSSKVLICFLCCLMASYCFSAILKQVVCLVFKLNVVAVMNSVRTVLTVSLLLLYNLWVLRIFDSGCLLNLHFFIIIFNYNPDVPSYVGNIVVQLSIKSLKIALL
jgi:hypothetical protein